MIISIDNLILTIIVFVLEIVEFRLYMKKSKEGELNKNSN
jgi:hypothetical protein